MPDMVNFTSDDAKNTIEKSKPILSQKSEMVIGTTTYIVNTIFKENARETAEDKLLRVVNNRISNELGNPQSQ